MYMLSSLFIGPWLLSGALVTAAPVPPKPPAPVASSSKKVPAASPSDAAGGAKDLTEDELRAAQAKMKDYDSLVVDFVQTRAGGIRGKVTKQTGKAIFTKPNYFKWMIETPKKQYMIFDGKSYYDYSPESNSAARYSPTGPQGYQLRQIIDLVLNFDALLKKYDLVKAHKDGDQISIQLKPKSEGEITAVELRLDGKESFVSMLKLTLRDKKTLSHEFKNPNHKPVPEQTFTLPAGVKVSDTN